MNSEIAQLIQRAARGGHPNQTPAWAIDMLRGDGSYTDAEIRETAEQLRHSLDGTAEGFAISAFATRIVQLMADAVLAPEMEPPYQPDPNLHGDPPEIFDGGVITPPPPPTEPAIYTPPRMQPFPDPLRDMPFIFTTAPVSDISGGGFCADVEPREANAEEIIAAGMNPAEWGGRFGGGCASNVMTPYPKTKKGAALGLLALGVFAWLALRD